MAHALTLESGQQPGAATLDLIRRLIAFDTVSERSNLALIEFVAGYLDDLGVASELVYDQGHGKANLYATLGPAGSIRHRALRAYRCGAGRGTALGQ